jgi:hypothetical protein
MNKYKMIERTNHLKEMYKGNFRDGKHKGLCYNNKYKILKIIVIQD